MVSGIWVLIIFNVFFLDFQNFSSLREREREGERVRESVYVPFLSVSWTHGGFPSHLTPGGEGMTGFATST
jgi:hypothetical protein